MSGVPDPDPEAELTERLARLGVAEEPPAEPAPGEGPAPEEDPEAELTARLGRLGLVEPAPAPSADKTPANGDKAQQVKTGPAPEKPWTDKLREGAEAIAQPVADFALGLGEGASLGHGEELGALGARVADTGADAYDYLTGSSRAGAEKVGRGPAEMGRELSARAQKTGMGTAGNVLGSAATGIAASGLAPSTLLAQGVTGAALGAGEAHSKHGMDPLSLLVGGGTGLVTGGLAHGIGQGVKRGVEGLGKVLNAPAQKPGLWQSIAQHGDDISLPEPRVAPPAGQPSDPLAALKGLSQSGDDLLPGQTQALDDVLGRIAGGSDEAMAAAPSGPLGVGDPRGLFQGAPPSAAPQSANPSIWQSIRESGPTRGDKLLEEFAPKKDLLKEFWGPSLVLGVQGGVRGGRALAPHADAIAKGVRGTAQAAGAQGAGDASGPAKAHAQERAYASGNTTNWAVQSVLASGRSGLPPADEQQLTEAVMSGDADKIASTQFVLAQRHPEYAKRMQDEYRSLQNSE